MSSSPGSGLLLFSPDACLLTELATHLDQLSPQDLATTIVVLPTMRLRVQLLGALMRQRKRAFVPPKIMTLPPFVEEALRKEHSSIGAQTISSAPAKEFELSLIGASILAKKPEKSPFRHLRPSHLHELLLLHKEAQELDLVTTFDALIQEALAGESAGSTQAVDEFGRRLEEVRVFFTLCEQALAEATLLSAQKHSRQQAQALLHHLENGDYQPAGALYICGLTSLAPFHVPVIAELLKHESTQVWLSHPPLQGSEHSSLASLISALHGSGTKKGSTGPVVHPRSGAAVACGSVQEEIAVALKIAGSAIRNGVPAQAIAFIVNGERSYTLPLLHETMDSHIPFNFALPIPFRLTPIGGWIEALTRFLTNSNLPANLLDFVCHPMSLALLLEQEGLKRIYDRESVLAAHFCQALSRFPFLGPLQHLANTTEVVIVKEVLGWALRQKESLSAAPATVQEPTSAGSSKKRTLNTWCSGLLQLAQGTADPAFKPGTKSDQPTLAFAQPARQFLQSFLGEVADSALGGTTTMSLGDFCTFLSEHLLDEPIHRIGEPLAGVQIIQFSESRYVPFEVGILLGCHEGDLPSRLPQDEVIDHFSKPTLGFRPQQYLESLQDLNVALLFSRIPKLFLLHNLGAAQSPNIPSRYVQMLVHSGFPQIAASELLNSDNPKAVVPLGAICTTSAKPQASLGPSEGVPWFLPTEPLSVSRLREFIQCPFRYKAHLLRLQGLQMPGSRMTFQSEGDLLHAVLEAFFSERCSRLPHLKNTKFPWEDSGNLPTEETEFCAALVRRLGLISHQILPTSAAGHALLLQLRLRSWPAFAKFIWQLQQQEPQLLKRSVQEWNFSCELSAQDIEGGPKTIFLKGSADLILRYRSALLIIDYKRKNLPTPGDVARAIDPQLLAYSMGSHAFAAPETIAGFWSILAGKWVPRLLSDGALAEPELTESLTGKRPSYCSEAASSLNSLLLMRHKTMAAAAKTRSPFYADPSQCGHCDLGAVCRKNDPDKSQAISRQYHLQDWKRLLKKAVKGVVHES